MNTIPHQVINGILVTIGMVALYFIALSLWVRYSSKGEAGDLK